MKFKKQSQEKTEEPQVDEQNPDYDEDFDFDMSIYDTEDEVMESTDPKKRRPNFTSASSKISPHDLEMVSIEQIKTNASKYGIRVESFTDDINDIMKMLGCLGEYWARIKSILGTVPRDLVAAKFAVCRKLVLEHRNKQDIPTNVYMEVLELRDMIYEFAQRKNLGILLSFSKRSGYAKIESQVVN